MAARSKVISLDRAAELNADGATVTVSSSSGLGCPDATLRAIGERFRATGSPRNITTIHPIAAGDMYGIDGIDHIAEPGLLRRVVAGSYPSGPSSMPSPKIWRMIYENEVEAYNIPSGILFHMHTEAAAKRPGVLTQVGMETYVDPRQTGGRMNGRTTEDLVELVEFDGQEWLYFRAIPVDVAIIRGTTADEAGNISMEHEGAYLGAMDQALAARNNGGIVIAQVKRVTAAGTLPTQQVRIPGNLVDFVVVDPEQMQTTQTQYDPAISGEIRASLESFEPVPWGTDKVIARRAAMELRSGEAVNLGFGISALVPRVVLEEGHAGDVTWAIEQGAVGGVPLLGFAFGCAANAMAIVPSPQQFVYFQGGGFDRTFLSFMQVGADGSVNVSKLAAKPHVTAGVGGFVDITANARNIVFSGYMTAGGIDLAIEDGRLQIRKEGKARKFVPEVEQITFSGKRATERGANVTYVTERCVIRLLPEGLTVTEIAPGVDLERDVLGQADVPLRVSEEVREMDARLFSPEPFGLELGEKGGSR
ncbi:MAG: acyl CoA:acetate/3-ketoacid CoA transferase [Chloroflexota bacterium]|nr:acyl CoA:acetate/3-ketoacid CoA transferase [Chloroflexota bacterium]